MYEMPNIPLNIRVYEIRRGNNNLDEILAYQIDQEKGFISYTFQTKREIPEVLEIYREIRDEYYPAAFIIPSPSPEMNGQPIRFDDNFALVIGYSKEIPPYVPLDKLIIASNIIIYEENGKPQEMYVEGACVLDVLNNNLELRSYTINLGGANLDDLLRFIRYNSRNNQSNRNGEMEKIGLYIFIGKDWNLSCKQSNIAPRDIKMLEIYK